MNFARWNEILISDRRLDGTRITEIVEDLEIYFT